MKRLRVIAVTSGDTISVVDGESVYPVRLARLIAADARSPDDNEQAIARAAQHALEQAVLGRKVALKGMVRRDCLAEAEVWVTSEDSITEVNVNEWMLRQRYGYDPELSPPPQDWVDYHAGF